MVEKTDELNEYIRTHYAYELKMVRWTSGQLGGERNQLTWNALFESFWVHCRLLRDFYTNDRPKNNNNVVLSNYTDMRPAEKKDHLTTFNAIDVQIAHLSRNRVLEKDEKRLTLEDVDAIAKWIESQHGRFVEVCDADLLRGLDNALAEEAGVKEAPPSATNHVILLTSTSSAERLSINSPGSALSWTGPASGERK